MADLEKKFCYALAGRCIWKKIKESNNFTNRDGLIIFPSNDFNVNSQVITLMPDYKKRMVLKRIVLVTDQENVIHMVENVGDKEIYWERIAHEEMEQLLKYYRLVHFCGHVSVVSLEEPFGNTSLLYDAGINLSSYILSAIFKVR